MTFDRTQILLLLCVLKAGCAGSKPQAPDVAGVYLPSEELDRPAFCAALREEIVALDRGLGGPVVEPPAPVPASAGSRWGAYGKNVIVQTIIGPLQPIIQSVRAAGNYEDKERLSAARAERASLRRAYLLGARDGAGCPD